MLTLCSLMFNKPSPHPAKKLKVARGFTFWACRHARETTHECNTVCCTGCYNSMLNDIESKESKKSQEVPVEGTKVQSKRIARRNATGDAPKSTRNQSSSQDCDHGNIDYFQPCSNVDVKWYYDDAKRKDGNSSAFHCQLSWTCFMCKSGLFD